MQLLANALILIILCKYHNHHSEILNFSYNTRAADEVTYTVPATNLIIIWMPNYLKSWHDPDNK